MSSVNINPEMAEKFKKYLDSCKSIIQKHGYMCQGVGAGENTPAYIYTVGLGSKGSSDYIVFGILEHRIINDVVAFEDLEIDKIYESENFICELPDGSTAPTRYMVKHIPLSRFKEYAFGAFNPELVDYLPSNPCQIVLSDLNNLLPGEEDYAPLPNTPHLWV